MQRRGAILARLLTLPTPVDPLEVTLDLGVAVLDMPARQKQVAVKRNFAATIALARLRSLVLQLPIAIAAMTGLLACLLMLPTPVDPLEVTLDLGVAVLDMPARQKQVVIKRNLPATIALARPRSLVLQSPIAIVVMANFLQRSNKTKRKPSSVNQRRGENGDALRHRRLALSPADPLEAGLAPSAKLPIARQSQNLVAKDRHL
jgi:hypothetical protein